MNKRVENIVAVAIAVLVVVTAPVWLCAAVPWMICTSRSLRSVGAEANRLSGMEVLE